MVISPPPGSFSGKKIFRRAYGLFYRLAESAVVILETFRNFVVRKLTVRSSCPCHRRGVAASYHTFGVKKVVFRQTKGFYIFAEVTAADKVQQLLFLVKSAV